MAIDNVFWHGSVSGSSSATDRNTISIRSLNKIISTDERVDMSMLPIGDGLTLAMKR